VRCGKAEGRRRKAEKLSALCLPPSAFIYQPSMPHPETDFDRRLEAAKLAAMAEFAAGAGHEINNPIAVIAGRAQLLLQEETSAQRRHELAVIHAQAMRVYEMIADMMLFARPPVPRFAACDVAAIARQVADELASKAKERQVAVEVDTVASLPAIDADATQLAVALRAICDNAVAAVRSGGHILIRVAPLPAPSDVETQGIVLSVTDDGPGIAVEVREHLFDPFFSGRQAGRGLGMGLAKAWRIVELHHGRIEVSSDDLPGTTFAITLPLRR
jgi:signal transduction histidine kinase